MTSNATRQMAPVEEQMRVLMAGTEFGDVATRRVMERELRARLEEDRPLRVYCGFDPTRVDLHLGHTVPMRKMRQFQDMGHEVTFLIGSFTATIGDPTGRDKTRPVLTTREIEENARTYTAQAFAILDESKTIIRYNGEWLSKLTFADVTRLTAYYTVQQFIRRENFAKRLDGGEPIHLSELLYALMQAYDAFELEADVQLGGLDQTFNLLAGRQLQEAMEQRPQVALTLPTLVGIRGGEKMSKSLNNSIGITDPPNEMFEALMKVPRDHVFQYFTLLTPMHPDQIEEMSTAVANGTLKPQDVNYTLAHDIVTMFHSADAAAAARAHYELIARHEVPDAMPEYALDEPLSLANVLRLCEFVVSNGEARRLVAGSGVAVNGEIVTEFTTLVGPGDELRVGGNRFVRLVAK